MDNDFFNSSGGGDPALFQSVGWYFGHPEVWITIFLWAMILIAIIKITKLLWRPRKILQLAIFLIIAGAILGWYIWLLKNAYGAYAEGLGNELLLLRNAKRGFLIVSTLSFVWIIRDWVNSRRSN